jgi:hypothetical protein
MMVSSEVDLKAVREIGQSQVSAGAVIGERFTTGRNQS